MSAIGPCFKDYAMPLSKIVAKSITDDTITTDQIADTSVHGRSGLMGR